jgi:hypothetical protein
MRKITVAAAAAAASFLAIAAPAVAQEETATVVVVHGVPDATVDVYVNDALTLDDFTPGTVTDALELPAGTYQIDVRAGDAAETDAPLFGGEATVEGGVNYTIVAHLTEGGDPTLTPFVNDTTQTNAGEGGVVVRHTAAAPAVDVYAGEDKVIDALANPESAGPLYLPVGTLSASVTAAGATDPVIGPADVPIEEGKVTIVYAIGSLEAENLTVAVQTIDVGVAAAGEEPAPTETDTEAAPVPTRVDTGNSGLAAGEQGPSMVLVASIAGLALLAGTTGALSLARSRRDG